MKGEIINCSGHKDIYFLETKTKSESTNLANLFASPAGRELFKYKPRPKLKHKLNPALEFFIQNKTSTIGTPETNPNNKSIHQVQPAVSKCKSLTTSSTTISTSEPSSRSRRNSIDLYEEAASILGLTCSQTDDCKCIECQCHYFDFDDDLEYSTTGSECLVDHSSSCTIQ